MMYSEIVEPGKCRGIGLTQSYFCKPKDGFTVVWVTLNPDSSAPTLAGVPGFILLVNVIASSLAWLQGVGTGGNKLQSSTLVPWSLYRGRCWQKGQEGVGEAGSMGSCHSLGSERWILPFGIAPCWDTSSSMHFWRSQKYLLIPKKVYRLQLHVVNFNRKVCVAFRNCGPGVFPTSHFCLNQTSAQSAHTYPGANLKQPWRVNGIIPGLSVQQKEISMNKTIFFSF